MYPFGKNLMSKGRNRKLEEDDGDLREFGPQCHPGESRRIRGSGSMGGSKQKITVSPFGNHHLAEEEKVTRKGKKGLGEEAETVVKERSSASRLRKLGRSTD